MSEFKQQKWSMEMIPKDILIEKNKRLEQALEEIKEDIEKIKDCTTTEMVEISTRKDYDGFLALKGISVKTTKILQKISEVIYE